MMSSEKFDQESEETTRIYVPANARGTKHLVVSYEEFEENEFVPPRSGYVIWITSDNVWSSDDGDTVFTSPIALLSALVECRYFYYDEGLATTVQYPAGFLDLPLHGRAA
jgi:hypothetical protein